MGSTGLLQQCKRNIRLACLSAVAEPFGIDPKVVESLAQRVAVDAEQLRSAQLIAPRFPQCVLEQRPLERGKSDMVQRTQCRLGGSEPGGERRGELLRGCRLGPRRVGQPLLNRGSVDP